VRPHRHRPGKWELVNLLQGRLDLVIFAASGEVKHRVALGPEEPRVAEIPGGEWHTFVFHAPAAVVLEVKPGPYEPELDKEFATWTPLEGDSASTSFVAWLESAAVVDTWFSSSAARRTSNYPVGELAARDGSRPSLKTKRATETDDASHLRGASIESQKCQV
jgi:hypothetical protein